MRKNPLSDFASGFVAALEYRDAEKPQIAMAESEPELVANSSAPAVAGPTEQEMQERVALARSEARSEAEREFQKALEHERQQMLGRIEKSLRDFSVERAAFFKDVERDLVQLALAIVRKILQRETQLDPTLLGALVRIAVDRMHCEGTVKLRMPPSDVELWRRTNESALQKNDWTIEPDETLLPGDCIVETELGNANFGLEAQMRTVEESLLQLLARRPEQA